MNKVAGANNKILLSNPVLFQELINRANDNLSIIDLPTGRYLYVNEMTCRSTGYTREEFRRMTVADIDPTIIRPWDAAKERRRRRRTSVFVREGVIKRKDGSCFPVEIHSSIVRIDGREYMVATARDITERKKALEVLCTAQEELERAVKEKTAELVISNETLKKEIIARAQVEKALRKSQIQLHRQKLFLEHKNIAMNEVLKQIEWEKRKVETNVALNTRDVLLPLIEKMQASGASGKYIGLLKERLRKIGAQFEGGLPYSNPKLTARELEIANMLKSGLANKDISELLHITIRSIEWHRYNIRNKLHLKGRRNNLRTKLIQPEN